MMKYKHITNIVGNNVCRAEGVLGIGNGEVSFMYTSDYLSKRFKTETDCQITTIDEAICAERGFQEGIDGMPRDFWRIRNTNLDLAQRFNFDRDNVEKDISNQQEIYGLAYSWGREAAIKESKFPFLKELPIRTVRVAR